MSIAIKLFKPYGFWANSYALQYGDNIALVDIGYLSDEIKTYILENKEKIKYILLTHCHFDHICGVEDVLKLIDVDVIIHKNDEIGLNNPTYSLCRDFGIGQPNIFNIKAVSNGEKLSFGDKEISVLNTPGHTSGSVCYMIDDVMFSGDTLFLGSIGRTDFITGNITEMMNSMKKLKELGKNFSVYSGHGDKTDLFYEIKTNPYMNI